METNVSELAAPSGMSAQIQLIAAALAKAQSQIRSAEKDRENPHLKASYATLASVWNAAREPLSAAGLSVTQPSSYNADRKSVIVVTVLMHGSGQWIRSELELPVIQATPQGIGSAITYARRYALSAVVGIAPDDETDDDGEPQPAPLIARRQVPIQQGALREYPAAQFKENAPKWREVIASGSKSPDDIIAMVETKGALSDAQKAEIRAMAPAAQDGGE